MIDDDRLEKIRHILFLEKRGLQNDQPTNTYTIHTPTSHRGKINKVVESSHWTTMKDFSSKKTTMKDKNPKINIGILEFTNYGEYKNRWKF